MLALALVGCGEGGFLVEGSLHLPGEGEESAGVEGGDEGQQTPDGPVDPGEEVADCQPVQGQFLRELHPKVTGPYCEGCHNPQGVAQHTDLVFQNAGGFADHVERNIESLRYVASQRLADHDNQPKVLLKALGAIEHGGGAVLQEDEEAFALLSQFVERIQGPQACQGEARDLYEGVELASPAQTLRRASLSLVGRLPTEAEVAAVEAGGEEALDGLLAQMLEEEAFYDRLKEGFNDILLTDALLSMGPENALDNNAYPDRRFYRQLSGDAEREARNGLRWGLAREPLELITHVVREDRPFTEILTADYIMVNPYSARAYGVRDRVEFADGGDRDEFRPVKLPAPPGDHVQGEDFPHAGLLTSYMFLRRYPSTNTNRNRQRARVIYDLFLATDVLGIAPRRADPTEVTEYLNPIVDANACAVCHQVIDPVAGALEAFDNTGRYRPPRDWSVDREAPGFGDELIPADQIWNGARWLAERIAGDRRFALATTHHVYELLVGRRPLRPPADLMDPQYSARLRAYETQRRQLVELAEGFAAADGYDLKALIRAMILSPLYRAAAVAPGVVMDEARRAELEDLGVVRLLTPEALSRKITAVFGRRWEMSGRDALSSRVFGMLYGGIDSEAVTERLKDPNGVVAAVAEVMANDVACENTARDFARPQAERLLFPHVSLDDVPGEPAADEAIRDNLRYLYGRLWGVEPDAEELQRSFALLASIIADGRRGLDAGEYDVALDRACRVDALRDDETYAVRGWMAVLSYMLADYQFLYE